LSVLSSLYSQVFSKFGVELFPETVQSPDSSVVVNGFPRWECFGQVTPLATGSLKVKNCVEDDAPGPFEAVFVFAFGKAFFHVFPGFFVKITWVGFFHR
jgi:hypothetical protein